MNSFPIFPKVGQHVRFDKVYGVYDYRTGNPLDIQIGTIGEVVQVEVPVGNQEIGSYIIYLGFIDARVIRLDWTVHKDILTIIPNTLAGQVLYGNK